ncbi:hypothetical protein [Sulfuritalea hydrogenivorans]|jgi:hypothetical protein|nr:hypothetical protein [Sulfuritalea hydrogenivorans]MDK9713155.1 hypothetical protein [Sulfuritalea sp.]
MDPTLRRTIAHPAMAIGSALLWGIVELIALHRARRSSSRPRSAA